MKVPSKEKLDEMTLGGAILERDLLAMLNDTMFELEVHKDILRHMMSKLVAGAPTRASITHTWPSCHTSNKIN